MWRLDKSEVKLRKLLSTTFVDIINEQYDKQILLSSETEHTKQLQNIKNSINRKLKNNQKLIHVILTLKVWARVDDEVVWNKNRYRLVFRNGVFNLQTGVFGPSKRDEYINDCQTVRPLYEKPDNEYINRVLIDGLYGRLFAAPCHMDCYLELMAGGLDKVNRRQCAINLGECGANGKSKSTEQLVYTFGSYARMGDNKTLLTGKKDKVSLANMNGQRFIVYEEPDGEKKYDTCKMKNVIGGSQKMGGARLCYSYEDEIDIHATNIINCNKVPAIMDDAALRDRLVVFEWVAKFTSDPLEVDHENHIYYSR
jgi:phage/plasmid-associated DNA primase